MSLIDSLNNGAITLTKTEEGIKVTENRFSPITGEPIEPEIGIWSKEEHIDQAIEAFQEKFNQIKDELDFYKKIKQKFGE